MLTYLLVWGLGSAHYPVFGGSNPPVSIWEHGGTSICSRGQRGPIYYWIDLISYVGSNPSIVVWEHG